MFEKKNTITHLKKNIYPLEAIIYYSIYKIFFKYFNFSITCGPEKELSRMLQILMTDCDLHTVTTL